MHIIARSVFNVYILRITSQVNILLSAQIGHNAHIVYNVYHVHIVLTQHLQCTKRTHGEQGIHSNTL